jgi:methyl-accepting chemotaxis protein
MRITPVVSIVVVLVLLLSWLSLHATNPNAELFDRAFAEIDRFTMLENALYRDVFTARAGTLRNYDPLVREINELYASLARLRETAAFDAKTAAAVDELAALVVQLEELVEKFKTNNALLHNSLAYFGRFSVRLASSDFGPAISSAAAAILNLTLDTSSSAVREVQERLDELARQARPSAEDESVGALLVHGRLLNYLLPVVDKTCRVSRTRMPFARWF